MENNVLSIIIPVYNEKNTILEIIKQIENVKLIDSFKKEIIIVDDFSIDWTRNILKDLENKYKIIYKIENWWKWTAINEWLKYINWKYIIIQDADLEYTPEDYNKLLEKILKKDWWVVYWSRNLNKRNKRSNNLFYFWWLFLSFLTNIIYKQNITDEATCYKMFDAKIFKKINIESKWFEFCPEVTAKVSRLWYKIKEVPISYTPRAHNQWKKIRLKDWIKAIQTLIKYRKWKN